VVNLMEKKSVSAILKKKKDSLETMGWEGEPGFQGEKSRTRYVAI